MTKFCHNSRAPSSTSLTSFLSKTLGQIPSSHFLTLFSKKHRYMLSSRYWGSSYKLGVRTEAYWSTRERLRIYQKKFCYNFLLRHCTKGICITAERYSVNVFPMQTIQWDWFMQSISAINTAKKCCIVVENSKKEMYYSKCKKICSHRDLF